MLLKLIHCRVPGHLKQPFSVAQGRWRILSQCPGFLGQAGGWESRAPSGALIAAFWRDAASYYRFMGNVHDKIFQQNGQRSTYESLNVTLLAPVSADAAACRSLLQRLKRATLLRLEELPLQTAGAEVQSSVPPQYEGMMFRLTSDPVRLLKFSFLNHGSEDRATVKHKEFSESRATILHQVDLEPDWLVLPSSQKG